MPERPNFLYIMTDQLRADWLGCMGHPVVKTPHIDALAARGTRFENFHVASPVCMPNRASFMTGRYPSVHGLRYNGCVLPERANTFVDLLRASGYQTASIGKSHLQPFTDRAPMDRTNRSNDPLAEAWKPDPAGYQNEEPTRYTKDGRFEFPTPYYGFDHVDVVTRHGDAAGGHYRQWFRERFENWEALADRANELPHDYSCPQAYRTPVPEDGYSTAYIRDRAIDYLDARATEDAPFFAYVSFPDPHHPFNPPGKYWDMYDPDDFDISLKYEDHATPPPPLQYARRRFETEKPEALRQDGIMASDRHLREAMALTAGMITMIDDAVGAIVAALEASGQRDNTVIIFNSDHGDYLGDFNMMLKGAWLRRSITRVPMIWSDPTSQAPRVSHALASTVDIAPTLLERAGLEPYHGMQGWSFLNAVSSDTTHRDQVLIEFNDLGPRLGFDAPARVRQLLSRDWQLTLYKDQPWGELYDLQSDPHECRNLWDDPAHHPTRARLTLDLAHMLMDQMDESPRSQRLA